MSVEAAKPPVAQPAPEETPGVARLRRVTGDIVGQTFFANLLAQAGESPLKAGILDGGAGERAFKPQLEAIYAERVGEQWSGPEGNFLFQHLLKQQMRIDRASARSSRADAAFSAVHFEHRRNTVEAKGRGTVECDTKGKRP